MKNNNTIQQALSQGGDASPSDLELIEWCFEEGLFERKIAELARFLKHKSPAHLYRVIKGQGNLSARDRAAIVEHWRASHAPAIVFAPVIQEQHGNRFLILKTEHGGELRIPLKLKGGEWIVGDAFDIHFPQQEA